MSNVKATPTSRKMIAEYANYFRRLFNMENQLYFPIVEIIELAICKIDTSFDFIILPENEMKTDYANYCPQTNIMTVREDVYIAACKDDGRHRFTLAHEMGHYLFHGNETTFSRCDNDDFPIYCDPEWQANTFASSLLMPTNLIKELDIETIMRECCTSRQATDIALKHIKNRKQ